MTFKLRRDHLVIGGLVVLLCVSIAVNVVITVRKTREKGEHERETAWFHQEVKAAREFKEAQIALDVYVDDRQQFFDGPDESEAARLAVKAETDRAKVRSHLDQANKEAEKLRPMLPGLANRRRFEQRLEDLLKSLKSTATALDKVGKAENADQVREALNVLSEQKLPGE